MALAYSAGAAALILILCRGPLARSARMRPINCDQTWLTEREILRTILQQGDDNDLRQASIHCIAAGLGKASMSGRWWSYDSTSTLLLMLVQPYSTTSSTPRRLMSRFQNQGRKALHTRSSRLGSLSLGTPALPNVKSTWPSAVLTSGSQRPPNLTLVRIPAMRQSVKRYGPLDPQTAVPPSCGAAIGAKTESGANSN